MFVLTLPLFVRRMSGDVVRQLDAGCPARSDPGSRSLALSSATALSYLVELPRAAASTGGPPRSGQMFAPYGRLVVLHLTIIFGALAIIVTGAPAAAIAVLVALKTALDLGLPPAPSTVRPSRRAEPRPGPSSRLTPSGLADQRRVRRVVDHQLRSGAPRQAARRSASAASPRARISAASSAGVLGVADRDGRDRDAARHLDDREQRVEPAEVLGRDRHADDRQRRLRGEHARQVGGAAGARR